MLLVSASIENFKLINNLRIEFSRDPERPLTVIRAENGSGKTTLLYALLWGLFGELGLDKSARGLRRTSAACRPGIPVTVNVSVVFEHNDELAGPIRYRLTRIQTETPVAGSDDVERSAERVELVQLTPSGDEARDPAIIFKLFPPRLKDVFFTNGEEVETFIAGTSASATQHLVHESIEQLLGLDNLEQLRSDLDSLIRKYRKTIASSSGGSAESAFEEFEEARSEVENGRQKVQEADDQITNMKRSLEAWKRQLADLQHIGSLADLLEQQQKVEGDLRNLEESRKSELNSLRELLSSESISWIQIGNVLNEGRYVLNELYDKNVIPGISLPVLEDRLKIGKCVCGESLEGDEHSCSARREFLKNLIAEQKRASVQSQKLTQTYHLSEASFNRFAQSEESEDSFHARQASIHLKLDRITEQVRSNNARLKEINKSIESIDEDQVSLLTTRIKATEGKLESTLEERGGRELTLQQALDRLTRAETNYTSYQKKADKHDELSCRLGVAQDLVALSDGAVKLLKTEYVGHVAERMSQIFMSAVGADPSKQEAVFTGVSIDENFNIVVETAEGRRLNPSYELNGASQRVLTLSFVWALTEIAGAEVPRIIDTPLGMISGTVKQRLVEEITSPGVAESPQFQVVLLLTRSEISGIEDQLDLRSGAYTTLSCNKDTRDLKYEWGLNAPTVKGCGCSHREACTICARHSDQSYGVVFRPTGVPE